MSSFYEDASLVMIPSGYKTSKVYSAKPTDGAGDLDFTRSNDTATRVGPDGLIEKVRTNVLLQSESFDNAAWTKLEVSVTANAAANPLDGESTADNIVPSVVSGGHYVNQLYTLTANVPYTISVYAKANGYDWIYLYAAATGSGQYRLFNVANGTLGISNGAQTSTITAAGGGWYRCTMTWTPTQSVSMRAEYSALSSNSVAAYAGDGTSGVLFYAAQLETGDIATDYIATTSAAVSVGPVANVPRLDYTDSTCPRLLLEPQRTNSLTYSENFDNAAWSKDNSTITANSVTSPSGYQDADTLTDTTANTRHRVNTSAFSFTAGTAYTLSVFVKKESSGRFLLLNAATGASARAVLNLDTLAITNIDGTGKVEDYGNGWYRFSVTGTAATTQNAPIFIQMQNAATDLPYVGNGSSFYIWGAQLEVGAYATSYVPSLGAAVTRGADAYHTNSLSSLHDTSSGFCLMFDYGQRAENADIAFEDFFSIQVSAGTQDGFRAEAAGSLNSEWRLYATNITASFGFPMVLSNIKTRNKVLLKVETTGIKIFADGALAVSQSGSVTIPTFGTLQPKRGTSQPLGTEIKQSLGMIYFSPLLDDADCIALTA